MNCKYLINTSKNASLVCAVIRELPYKPLHEIIIRPVKDIRNLEQNAKMWAMLTDISNQVEWYGQKLSKEEWKDMFTAALKKLKVVPGVEGGFVVVGAHTSKMTIAEMSELIEFATAFGTQHNVNWNK